MTCDSKLLLIRHCTSALLSLSLSLSHTHTHAHAHAHAHTHTPHTHTHHTHTTHTHTHTHTTHTHTHTHLQPQQVVHSAADNVNRGGVTVLCAEVILKVYEERRTLQSTMHLAWGSGQRHTPTFIVLLTQQLQEAEQRPDELVVGEAPLLGV